MTRIWTATPGVARLVMLTTVLLVLGWAPRATAATERVCAHGCAFSGVGAAVAAAAPGDQILVAPGTSGGGFTIAKNLTLTGAGAGHTVISGGGPVVTVGVAGATSQPTVSITGVTITGGNTRTSFDGYDVPFPASLGGGVLVPPGAVVGVNGERGPGATLTIADAVISGNHSAPSTSVDAGFSCGAVDCQAALAGGGGLDSWGHVTVRNSVVSGNTAGGPVSSDADGAGIYAQQGTLVVDRSYVTGNRATVTAPNGRFAEGAGIMFDTFFSPGATCQAPQPACQLIVRDSFVTGNASSVTNDLPAFGNGQLIVVGANAGGIHVGDGIPTTVQGTTIDNNAARATDPEGEPSAIDAGLIIGDSPLAMSGSHVDRNQIRVFAATLADAGPSGSAIELDGGGTIDTSSISDNVSSVTAPGGDAENAGTLAVFNFTDDPALVTVRRSEIAGNVVLARSATGTAEVQGGGVINNSLLEMDNVPVSGNTVLAEAPAGVAQGGGIWNGVDLSGPPVELTLDRSPSFENRLGAGRGITLQGGGLYTTAPVTLTGTSIEYNSPDQCFGCSQVQMLARRSHLQRIQRGRSHVAGTVLREPLQRPR